MGTWKALSKMVVEVDMTFVFKRRLGRYLICREWKDMDHMHHVLCGHCELKGLLMCYTVLCSISLLSCS